VSASTFSVISSSFGTPPCLDRRHEHHRIRPQAGLAALDVEELFGAEIGAETGLRDDVVGQLERCLRRYHRIAAVGDVGEGTAMHQRRIVLHRLDEIRLEGVLEQCRHRTVRTEFAHRDRRIIARVTEHDVTETVFEVGQARCETEDRHDLRRDRDIEPGFPHDTVGIAAETGGYLAQRAVVHVDDTPPGNPPRVDIEFVVPVHVIVDQCSQQIVRGADRVEVAGEVQIDIGHRDDLRITAAGRTALHSETRTQARLAQADRGVPADEVHCVAETYGRGRLALAGGGR
jgi:hypothetical protein